jgi:hypothetical protein
MTLVIGKIDETGVRLIADWRLTWADQRIPNYLNGTLKAWILHPALCIAYASDDHIRAERAIRSIGITWHGYVDLDLVLDRLQQESSAGSEFLLASETKGPSLSLIRSGGAHRQEASARIGDKAAYTLYLRLLPTSPPFTNPAGSASATKFSAMETAFDRLLFDGECSDRGRDCDCSRNTSTRFRYQVRRYLWSPPLLQPDDQPFDSGTPEAGALRGSSYQPILRRR